MRMFPHPRPTSRRPRTHAAPGSGAAPAFEAIEPRVMLDSALPFEVYYPEGYASDTINEFVPITNPNNFQVEVELHARYELGARDQLIGTQTIPAFARGGFTVSDAGNPGATVVRKGEPYALIVRSSLPVSANFSHYDFGTAVGEAFTGTVSTTWTFADGLKDTTLARDFILVFNPSDFAATVTITLYGQGGLTTSSTISVDTQRRAGWSIEDIPAQPAGLFAARVTSTTAVVACQTHYELQSGRGWGLVGNPQGGTVSGTVPKLGFDDAFYDTNGAGSDPNAPRFQADSFVSVLNTSPSDATVTMRFVFDATTMGYYQAGFAVPAQSVRVISVRDLGFQSGDEFGLLYESTGLVTVTGTVYQGQDATGVTAATTAATVWDFGEGYMSQARGGAAVLEDVRIFNPNSGPNDVTISLYFPDGSTLDITDVLDGGELSSSRLDQYAALRNRAPDSWYGIRVTSFQPVVAMMEHWDAGNGGGFSTFGTAGGTLRPLSSYVLVT